MRTKKRSVEDAKYERGYVYNFHFHLIWVTKYRRPLFVKPQDQQDLKTILQKLADEGDIVIEEMEIMPDHVHLLVSFKPKYRPTDVVKLFKGASARLFLKSHPDFRSKAPKGHVWSASYYMSTLGNMSKETVRKYIQDQYKK